MITLWLSGFAILAALPIGARAEKLFLDYDGTITKSAIPQYAVGDRFQGRLTIDTLRAEPLYVLQANAGQCMVRGHRNTNPCCGARFGLGRLESFHRWREAATDVIGVGNLGPGLLDGYSIHDDRAWGQSQNLIIGVTRLTC
jgi:hypothetical protein